MSDATGFWVTAGVIAAAGAGVVWWLSTPPQIIVATQRRRTPIQIKGQRVAFEMQGKSVPFKLPASYGMIHDPTGKLLPKCHVYFGPFQKLKAPVQMTGSDRAYYGSSYPGKEARVEVPKGPWRILGNVVQIFYWRPGQHEGSYFHPFSRKVTEPLRLSQSGSFYRLSLPEGCIVNERGFVWP